MGSVPGTRRTGRWVFGAGRVPVCREDVGRDGSPPLQEFDWEDGGPGPAGVVENGRDGGRGGPTESVPDEPLSLTTKWLSSPYFKIIRV